VADAPLVAILADDLIWATRLDRLVRDAGGRTALVRSLGGLEGALGGPDGRPDGVVVDLTGRAYDGVDAIRRAAATGAAVVAVGQHDDRAGRDAARAAGASDVFAYGRLFATGPRVMGDWLRRIEGRQP
jgi:DNA-binding NarL/FixJ family response regulator